MVQRKLPAFISQVAKHSRLKVCKEIRQLRKRMLLDSSMMKSTSRNLSTPRDLPIKMEPGFDFNAQSSSATVPTPSEIENSLPFPSLLSQTYPLPTETSFKTFNTIFKDELSKSLYKVELNKEGGVAGILVKGASDPTRANEFRPTYKRKDGKSFTISCVHCNKPLLEYNHSMGKLFALGNLEEHGCSPIPITVLEEKYELLRAGRKITRQWWIKKSQEHDFPLQIRYTTACRILRSLRSI